MVGRACVSAVLVSHSVGQDDGEADEDMDGDDPAPVPRYIAATIHWHTDPCVVK